MRTRFTLAVGQVWVSSDPRRYRKVIISGINASQILENPSPTEPIMVQVVYPVQRGTSRVHEYQVMAAGQFLTTGRKGYVRVS